MNKARTSPPTRLWRLVRLGWHLLAGIATAAFVLPRLTTEQREHRIQRWCGKILDIFNVRVVMRGQIPDAGTEKTLFVSNHISWLDIWALKHLHPMRFVAKSEIRGWPVIGWLAEKANTLFITRQKRLDTGRMMNSVEEALRQGECLCFFPEGTTTDGTELKPFKSSLFQAAVNADAAIWPLAIHYPDGSGGINTEVAYSGDTTMLQSLWAVLRQPGITVELSFDAPISAVGKERRQLAEQARQAIASRLPPTTRKAPGTAADPPDAAR